MSGIFCRLCGRPLYRGSKHVCLMTREYPAEAIPSSTIPCAQLRVPKLETPEVKLVSIELRDAQYIVQEQLDRKSVV